MIIANTDPLPICLLFSPNILLNNFTNNLWIIPTTIIKGINNNISNITFMSSGIDFISNIIKVIAIIDERNTDKSFS